MSLTLHFHPLSSFCQKVVLGLYELEIPFDKNVVDLFDPAQRQALARLWPLCKFPVLEDHERGSVVAESSIILEYLDQKIARRPRLIPADIELARACRMRDRLFDLHVNTPVGKIVADKLRPEGERDRIGVEQAKAQLEAAYEVADAWLSEGPWALGERFSMADCAAAPALLYSNYVVPYRERWRNLRAYYDRLAARPTFARVLEEAQPYWASFPG